MKGIKEQDIKDKNPRINDNRFRKYDGDSFLELIAYLTGGVLRTIFPQEAEHCHDHD